MAEILAVKSLCGGVGGGGFQSIAWSQPQSGLAVTTSKILPLGGLVTNGAYIAHPLLSAWFCESLIVLIKRNNQVSVIFGINRTYITALNSDIK